MILVQKFVITLFVFSAVCFFILLANKGETNQKIYALSMRRIFLIFLSSGISVMVLPRESLSILVIFTLVFLLFFSYTDILTSQVFLLGVIAFDVVQVLSGTFKVNILMYVCNNIKCIVIVFLILVCVGFSKMLAWADIYIIGGVGIHFSILLKEWRLVFLFFLFLCFFLFSLGCLPQVIRKIRARQAIRNARFPFTAFIYISYVQTMVVVYKLFF